MSHHTLARIRQRLGFSTTEVAAAGGWSRRDFGELERSGELDVQDLLKLTDIYGVDVGTILDRGSVRRADLPVAALLKGNADILTADTRFAMTEAMSVARDIRTVEDLLELQPARPVTSFGDDLDLSHPREGHVREMARGVREPLRLEGPIPSVVDDLVLRLGVLVFVAPLSDRLLDAFSTWSADTGPLIVVNEDSPRVRGPLGLRATLAHEVCHLLFDRHQMRTIDSFCEIERPTEGHVREFDRRERIERRARAFQAELLAPQADLLCAQAALAHLSPDRQLASLCTTWGLGPVAMAWQIRNANGPDFTQIGPITVDASAFDEWSAIRPADGPRAIPAMRRGRLLALVQRGLHDEALSVSWARELLRIGVEDFDRESRGWMS